MSKRLKGHFNFHFIFKDLRITMQLNWLKRFQVIFNFETGLKKGGPGLFSVFFVDLTQASQLTHLLVRQGEYSKKSEKLFRAV